MNPRCCRCNGPADFRFSRDREVEWGGRIWPVVEARDYCEECHSIDFPEEIEIQMVARAMARKELN